MRPVKTPSTNFTYLGPTEDIGDLPCQRAPDGKGGTVVYSVWEPTAAERDAIARGANIELGIYSEPIPPVSVGLFHPTPTELDVAEAYRKRRPWWRRRR